LYERKEVGGFLQAVKETISNPVAGPGWVLVTRQENKECILQLGFKNPDIKETSLGFSVEDYCDGP